MNKARIHSVELKINGRTINEINLADNEVIIAEAEEYMQTW